jgi:hypothetical protein
MNNKYHNTRVVQSLNQEKINECLEYAMAHKKPLSDFSTTCIDIEVIKVYNADGTVKRRKIGEKGTRISKNAKGYIQIKTNNPLKPNEKVQLQQLLVWNHPDIKHRQFVRENIGNTKLECSHICKNKGCMEATHIYLESSKINKERSYCSVWYKTNRFEGTVYTQICKHIPRCICNYDQLLVLGIGE